MALYYVICVNEAPGCYSYVEQPLDIADCTNVTIRLAPNNNAAGPFDIYIDSTGTTPLYSGVTREQLIEGVDAQIGPCPSPTPSQTPTQTPTPSITPTITPTITNTPGLSPTPTPSVTQTSVTPTPTITNTPSVTASITPTPSITPSLPLYYAYIFAEPQDGGDDNTLLSYATANGGIDWYSWYAAGVPNNAGGAYSNDLDVYVHQPSFSGGGNYVSPQVFKSPIAQVNGQIINGISQAQYTFGSIQVDTSLLNVNLRYFYSIWVPLAGVGGSINDMTIDVGTTNGGNEIYGGIPTVIGTTSLDVTVTSGGVIPAGTYRVLWVSPNFNLPSYLPSMGSIYFRGVNKT
jgi:hypothetical protein